MIEKRSFEGGMNQDMEESLIPANQYRFAFNIRTGNSGLGAKGVVTTIEGNRLVSTTLPAGGNRVIGTVDDDTNNRTVYVIYNSNGNNRILQYDHNANTITTIYEDTGNTLNLNVNYLITGIDVVVGEQDTYLLFTDNYGEPKNINIDAGIRTFDAVKKKFKGLWVAGTFAIPDDVYYMVKQFRQPNGTTTNVNVYYRCTAGTSADPAASGTPMPSDGWDLCPSGYIYTAVNEEFTTAIVKPPLTPPVVQYSSNSIKNFNNLTGSLWQFKYCYVTEDGRESAWSPVSTFANPLTRADSTILSIAKESIYKNNEIKVWAEVPDFIKYRYIKIAVRKNNDDKAPGDFYLVSKIDVSSISSISSADPNGGTNYKLYTSIVFDNSGNLLPINAQQANQLFSWIPVKAKAQAITDKNRIIYANITEGRDIDLSGPYGINTRPPITEMFERSNPYLSNGVTRQKTTNGNVSATALTSIELANDMFLPGLFNSTAQTSGAILSFPTAVSAGIPITITVPLSITNSTAGTSTYFSSISFTETVVPQTSAVSDVINRFTSAFNNNSAYNLPDAVFGGQFTVYGLSAVSDTVNRRLVLYPSIPQTLYTTNGATSSVYFILNKIPIVAQSYAIQSFKRGSNQEFGIVYSDKYGRLSTVITHDSLKVNSMWWRDESVSGSSSAIAGNIFNSIGQRFAQIRFNHDAPSWAEKFHIVKTNRNGIKRYVSLPMSKQTYLGKRRSRKEEQENQSVFNELDNKFFYRGYISPNSVQTTATSYTPTTAASIGGFDAIYIPLNALTNLYNSSYSELASTQITYSYSPGDRIRFVSRSSFGFNSPQTNLDFAEPFLDVEILTYFPELNSIVIRSSDLPNYVLNGGNLSSRWNALFFSGEGANSDPTQVGRVVFELYTPDNDYTSEYYYEMYSGDIDKSTPGRYLHTGNVANQTTTIPATIQLFNGDTFLKPRSYVTIFDNTTPATVSGTQTRVDTIFVEEANYYDKTISSTWGAGRPNVTIKNSSQTDEYAGTIKAYTRPTTMRYSEPLLPNQGFNGLGTIYDTSFEDANPSLRSIQLLHTDGGKTFVFHEDAVGVMQNDRQVITTVDGQNLSIAANTPISDITYYNTRAGIGTNPESFAFMNNRKYFFDADQGQVCRISNDGVTPINMYGMDRYFKQVSRAMNTNIFVDNAFGGYDKRFNEYILSFRIGSQVQYTAGQTSLGMNTFTIGVDTSIYDVYVGQFTKVYLPAVPPLPPPFPTIGTAPAVYDVYVSSIAGNSITYSISVKGFSDLQNVLANSLPYQIGLFVSQTVAFNEDANAWSSFYGYIPDMISSAGVELVTYRAGALYVHDAVSSPMNFYGIAQDGYIDIVSNPQPAQVKVWNTMSLNTLFTNETGVDTMSIPSSSQTVVDQAMQSGVLTSNNLWATGTGFTYKEQQAFIDYMRAVSSPAGNFIEGEKVRGFWQKTRIKFAGGQVNAARIISATFNYFMSNYTR